MTQYRCSCNWQGSYPLVGYHPFREDELLYGCPDCKSLSGVERSDDGKGWQWTLAKVSK